MSIAKKFNIPPALFETIKKMNAEGTEYQEKVKALLKKKGFTSIGQMSPEEKKDFFNTLDSMHQAKNEEVELDEAINHLQMAKHHQALAKEHDRISHKAAGNDEDDLSIAHSDQSEVHQDAAKAHLQAHKTGNPKDVASAKKATKQSLQNDTTRIMRSNYTHFYNVTKGRKSSTGEDDHKDYNYSNLRSGADAIKKGLNEEVELDEAIPKSTGHALVHSSSGKIVAKGNKEEMMKKMKELNAKEKGSHHLGRTSSGKVGDTFGLGPSPADKLSVRNEEVEKLDEVKVGDKVHLGLKQKGGSGMRGTVHKIEGDKVHVNLGKEKFGDRIVMGSMKNVTKEEVKLDEGKSGTGYELYHKDFSSAMAHAYDFAKKKYNIEIDPLEIDRNVAMGPRKPSSGKANAYRLLDKTGKKAIQVQVANLDNKRYELNMYKEDVELEENLSSSQRDTHFSLMNKHGVLAKSAKGAEKDKHRMAALDHQMALRNPDNSQRRSNALSLSNKLGVTEEVELDETNNARSATKSEYQKSLKTLEKMPEFGAMSKSLKRRDQDAEYDKRKQDEFKKSLKKEEVELDESMSAAQIKKLRDAYGNIDKIDVSGQPYKNLVAFLDKQNLDTLKMLAGAKIKFISPLAQNRVVRKMNESIGSTVGGALGQYAGSKMGLEGPGRAHGEVLGRQLEKFARELFKKLTGEEIELDEEETKEFMVKFEKQGKVSVKNYTGKSDLDVRSKAKVDAKRMGMTVASIRLKEEVEEAVNPQKSMKRASLSVERAKEVMRHQKEIGTIRKKRESLRNSFDPVNTVIEAYKKNKMKKEATAKDKNKSVQSGNKLSGKTEPIEIDPELKEQKT